MYKVNIEHDVFYFMGSIYYQNKIIEEPTIILSTAGDYKRFGDYNEMLEQYNHYKDTYKEFHQDKDVDLLLIKLESDFMADYEKWLHQKEKTRAIATQSSLLTKKEIVTLLNLFRLSAGYTENLLEYLKGDIQTFKRHLQSLEPYYYVECN